MQSSQEFTFRMASVLYIRRNTANYPSKNLKITSGCYKSSSSSNESDTDINMDKVVAFPRVCKYF